MSTHESGLKRTTSKDKNLQLKLVNLRKKRDGVADKILKLSKKRNITTSDIQRMSRYQSDLLKHEEDMTKLIEELRKNTESMNRFKEKVNREQQKKLKGIVKSLNLSTSKNTEYLNKSHEISSKLDELSTDIKNAVQEKELIKFDVFLSHSNLDKEVYVTELSEKLSSKGLKVFEDIKVFKIGHSQTEMMNMGILNSRFVVAFLSSNFIKSGWSDYEFKSFLNREINEKRVIILPIWHEVTFEEVQQYNPYLVDKFALNTQKYSVDEIVNHINQVVSDSMSEIKEDVGFGDL